MSKKPLSPKQIADVALEVLDEHKAQNVRCLEVSHLTPILDYMIVASGRSDRHVRALGDALIEDCKDRGIQILGTEGQESGEWLLVDLVDVVVHVMLPRAREFYEIEKLWEMSPARDDANRSHLGVQ